MLMYSNEEFFFLLHVHILAIEEFDIIPLVNVLDHAVRVEKNIVDNVI